MIGPPRIWVRGTDGPGLMMSRSFGDEVAHSCGVISTPEVRMLKLSPDCKGLILASDGLTEKLTNTFISKVLEKYIKSGDILHASRNLVKRAQIKWKSVSHNLN